MPSPSKFALFSGLTITAGIFYGGAWLASGVSSADALPASSNRGIKEVPILAPAPDLVTEPDSGAQQKHQEAAPGAPTRRLREVKCSGLRDVLALSRGNSRIRAGAGHISERVNGRPPRTEPYRQMPVRLAGPAETPKW